MKSLAALAYALAWVLGWAVLAFALGWALSGCAVAGPLPIALGQSESLSCAGKSRVSYDDQGAVGVVCEGELRWVTGGPLSSGFAQALAGARNAALAVVGAPSPQ